MKELTGLNREIMGYGNKPIPAEEGRNMIVKDVILSFLAQARMPSAKEDRRAWKTMWKIDETKDDSISLEDAEMECLKTAVETNKNNFPAVIRGAVYDLIENAKET